MIWSSNARRVETTTSSFPLLEWAATVCATAILDQTGARQIGKTDATIDAPCVSACSRWRHVAHAATARAFQNVLTVAMSLVCSLCLVADGAVEVGWCDGCQFASHSKCMAAFVVRGKSRCPTCRADFSAKTIARGYEAGIPALEEIIGDHFLVARLKLDMAGAFSDCGRAKEALQLLRRVNRQDELDRLTAEMLQAAYWRIYLRTGDVDGTFRGVGRFLRALRRTAGDCPASMQVRLQASLTMTECCLKKGMPRAAARFLQGSLVDPRCGKRAVPVLEGLARLQDMLGNFAEARASRETTLRILEQHGTDETSIAFARAEYELAAARLQGGWSPELQGATRELKKRVRDDPRATDLISRTKTVLPAAHSAKRMRWKTPMEDMVLRRVQ